MKTYMPLNGLWWSRDSGSANCDMPQSAVLGRPGGVKPLAISHWPLACHSDGFIYEHCCLNLKRKRTKSQSPFSTEKSEFLSFSNHYLRFFSLI